MTKKLTKNDSMRNDAQDFKIIVAAFEAILSKNHVHLDYFTNWSKRKLLNYGDPIYIQWMEWAASRNPEKWVVSAFVYEEYHLPKHVWNNIDHKWQNWLQENIKK